MDVARDGPTELLQVGSYPEWNQQPLEAAFTMHRYFEADNKKAFLTAVAAGIRSIATRSGLGAGRAMIDMLPKLEIVASTMSASMRCAWMRDNLTAPISGQSLLTPVL